LQKDDLATEGQINTNSHECHAVESVGNDNYLSSSSRVTIKHLSDDNVHICMRINQTNSA